MIHTKDLESHQTIFDQICQNLSRYNLAINLQKSVFVREKLNYLGFKVSADCYSATDEKIKAIVEYPRKHLEVFLVFVVQLIFTTKLLKSVVNYYDRCMRC